MTPKLQNTLHWILVIALTIVAIAPGIDGLVHGNLTGQQLIDGIVGILIAIATKFVYYATTIQGTTLPATNTGISVSSPPATGV